MAVDRVSENAIIYGALTDALRSVDTRSWQVEPSSFVWEHLAHLTACLVIYSAAMMRTSA